MSKDVEIFNKEMLEKQKEFLETLQIISKSLGVKTSWFLHPHENPYYQLWLYDNHHLTVYPLEDAINHNYKLNVTLRFDSEKEHYCSDLERGIDKLLTQVEETYNLNLRR
jgi:hypothetical protein